MTRRDGMPWTRAENDSLRAYWADPALRRSDVGKRLGRTDKSVAFQARHLDLPPKAGPWGMKAQAKRKPQIVLSEAHRAELARRGIRWEAR